MTTHRLTFKEEHQLEEHVLRSITTRYTGALERWEDPRGKQEDTYTPLYDVHDLAVELWGEYFTAETLARFELRLCQYGAEREAWPEAFCEEELEAEREERLRDEDYDEWLQETTQTNIPD